MMAVALLAACPLAGCTPQHPSAASRAARDGVPATIRVAGRSIPYVGSEHVASVSVPSRSSRLLPVPVDDAATDDGMCGPPVARVHVSESPTVVRVRVADYRAPIDPRTICAGTGFVSPPETVTLRRALGSRRLVDASTGRAIRIVDGSVYPDLPTPPAGLRATSVALESGAVESRSWTAAFEPIVTLSAEPPASVRQSGPFGRVALQSTVHGTAATVYANPDKPGGFTVQWTPNAGQTVTLDVENGGGHRWTASAALALALTATGYRTEATGRLGAPTVAGIVAATFNSADGPVDAVPELLKSSGVVVGLDCAGVGRVTVRIRGAMHTIDCAAEVSHHEFGTEGEPFAQFRLSVTAGSGVRWALSLARTSLDGS